MTSRRQVVGAIGAATGLVALSGGVALASSPWLADPPTIPPVELADQDGRSVRLDELVKGRTVIINFLFTGCASVCPPQTAILRAARSGFAQSPGRPLLVSITVDPLGDGPAQLRAYADKFDLQTGVNNGWVFLTGAPKQVQRAMAAFGEKGDSPEGHSGLVWIGNSTTHRWTRTAAINGPQALLRLVDEAGR